MNIHIIKSAGVSEALYSNVFEIVNQVNRPLCFLRSGADSTFDSDEIDEEKFRKGKFNKQDPSFPEMSITEESVNLIHYMPALKYPKEIRKVKWDVLFNKCNEFRAANSIDKQDCVILLTELANEKNWFAAGDPSGKLNFFVHTDQWEFFIPCDPRFPVAYEVMVAILHKLMFQDYDELKKHYHKIARGCVNDFCENKKDITFKLRTADICPDCQEILLQKEINPAITNQIFKTLDDIRGQMLFRERFKTTHQPSRLAIKGPRQRIFFTDLGNTELRLTPLEKTVFLLFLKHEEGLQLNELFEHKQWLEETYSVLGNGTIADMRNSIEQLINPIENSVSEKISRIRNKIEQITGEDLAGYYIIEGLRGEKKTIKLDRNLIAFEMEWREH